MGLHETPVPKRTLGLTGVTINAMALIAPGAFLWMTFQLQAAQTGPDGTTSTAFDMWQGIVFALLIAFLTAISYSEMAKRYPDAGYGSAYYFAEKAFMDQADPGYARWARLSKRITGWAAHLFYWVYPGVMVSFMAILVSYVAGLFGAQDGHGNAGLPLYVNIGTAVIFSLLVGFIAVRGITGSTLTNLIVNIIQLTSLIVFSGLAIAYRLKNPDHALFGVVNGTAIGHATAWSILVPHSLSGVIFQSTIAILILVGFESCTALGAEARNPSHSVPRGVILSLVIQGLFAYLVGYFAANFALSDKLVYHGTDAAGKAVTYVGMAAAAQSQAPLGDMMRLFGDSLLGGLGFGLAVTMAVTVGLAILGTTLSCVNTAVRISYAMAKDQDMPEIMGLMHGEFATPAAATWILVGVSAVLGAVGVYSVVSQTGIGIASNLGTFILYALICVWTIMAFMGRPERNIVRHVVVPGLGLVLNLVMVVTIFYLSFAAGGASATEGYIALGIAGSWALVSIVYYVAAPGRRRRQPTLRGLEPAA